MPCCQDRPGFLEPCPRCGIPVLCAKCFYGAKATCSHLPPPRGPLKRQLAVGVQSPKAEEIKKNK